MVIHDVCQVVCRQRIGTLIEHLVVKGRSINLNVTANQVVHLDNLILGHLKTNNPDIATRNALLDLLSRERERCGQLLAYRVVVGEGLTLLLSLLAQNIQLLCSIKCIVCPTGLHKLLCVLEIDLTALALAVGSVRATNAYTLIDLNTTPTKRLNYIILGTRHEALRIGILDTQNHLTTVATSKQIVVKCCTNTSHMKGTRRARCKEYS